jgi:hypothetical protein
MKILPESLSQRTQEEFRKMCDQFPGPRIKGKWLVRTLEPLGPFPRLNSSIYKLQVASYSPNIYPHNGLDRPLPKKTCFRAQCAKRRGDDVHYLAFMAESTENPCEFLAHFETNDREYAETHKHITWERAEGEREGR